MMTLIIEIPALDRFCDWLETRDKASVAEEIKNEIIHQLEKAAKAPAAQTSQETRKAPQEPPKPQPTEKPTEKPTASVEATPDTKPVTLDAVQRAAAQMRDDGKLKAVTDMFPEFGIKKLSDLKGDQLQQFGERLRAMGAKI